MMSRRAFALHSCAGLAALCVVPACSRVSTRPDVLRQLVLELVVADVRALQEVSGKLSSALRELAASQGKTLEAARQALRAALLAWQRAQAFRSGPLVETNALLRSTFWPARKQALGAALADKAPVNAQLVESLGVDAKGLYALELMLFDPEARAEWFDEARRARAYALALAFADDVRARAELAAQKLGDGREFADKLAEAGQESIDRLVSQLVETSETIASDRLTRVLGLHEHGRLLPAEIHGGFSGLSKQLPLAWLLGTQRIYLGANQNGLGALVKQAAPAIDTRVRTAFSEAVAALQGLPGTLEQAAVSDHARLQAAASKAKQLEVALKSDLAASLGVTLSIVSGDGD